MERVLSPIHHLLPTIRTHKHGQVTVQINTAILAPNTLCYFWKINTHEKSNGSKTMVSLDRFGKQRWRKSSTKSIKNKSWHKISPRISRVVKNINLLQSRPSLIRTSPVICKFKLLQSRPSLTLLRPCNSLHNSTSSLLSSCKVGLI